MAKRFRDAGCFHDRSHLDDDERERQTSRTRTKTRSALKALEHRSERRKAVLTWDLIAMWEAQDDKEWEELNDRHQDQDQEPR